MATVPTRLLFVPYAVGRKAQGMGAGPLALAQAAAQVLGTDDVRRISLAEPRTTEVAACFDLNRQLATEVSGDELGLVTGEPMHAQRISLHLDLDVLDPAHGRANQYATLATLTIC